MGDLQHYVIRGGIKGRERLKLVSRVMHPNTCLLFERAGVAEGMICIDVGCGSGDVTLELSRRVGSNGKVIGADLDQTKIDLARQEAADLAVGNVEFRLFDVRTCSDECEFDLVYARFLLTHLRNPASVVGTFYRLLKPGGLLITEDIDYSGHFVFPESPAFNRYHELYCAAVRKRGGDPDIGLRLPLLLKGGGFADVDMAIAQPMGMKGEVKLLNPITMENIADAVLEDNLATREEVARLVRELYDFAANDMTLAGAPRIVQVWGRRLA